MRNACRILTIAIGAAAIAACHKAQPPVQDNQDMSPESNLAAGAPSENVDIETLPGDMIQIEVLLPYSENARQAEFHAHGNVEAVDYRGDGVLMRGALPRRLLTKFDPFRFPGVDRSA